MNISAASELSGLSAKTIRYYEKIDLITPVKRAANGYRDYSADDLDELKFVHRARQTGFSIDECRDLLSLYKNPSRHSKDVKTLVMEKADQVAEQIETLKQMHAHLIEMAEACRSDEQPECAIINELSDADRSGAPCHD